MLSRLLIEVVPDIDEPSKKPLRQFVGHLVFNICFS